MTFYVINYILLQHECHQKNCRQLYMQNIHEAEKGTVSVLKQFLKIMRRVFIIS